MSRVEFNQRFQEYYALSLVQPPSAATTWCSSEQWTCNLEHGSCKESSIRGWCGNDKGKWDIIGLFVACSATGSLKVLNRLHQRSTSVAAIWGREGKPVCYYKQHQSRTTDTSVIYTSCTVLSITYGIPMTTCLSFQLQSSCINRSSDLAGSFHYLSCSLFKWYPWTVWWGSS